jgi:hypothetical protein
MAVSPRNRGISWQTLGFLRKIGIFYRTWWSNLGNPG